MKTLLSVLSLSLFLGVAAQAQISFTFTGTVDDGNDTPFEISFTGPDTSPALGNYGLGFAGPFAPNLGFYELGAYKVTETPIFDSVSGDIFTGSFVPPASVPGDLFEYLFFSESNSLGGSTFFQTITSKNDSDIGFEYNGSKVEYLELGGSLDFFLGLDSVDTSTLLSGFLPNGTYDLIEGYGTLFFSDQGGFVEMVAETVTIDVTPIPEPAHFTGIAGLLGLGLVLFLRRRKQAVQQ